MSNSSIMHFQVVEVRALTGAIFWWDQWHRLTDALSSVSHDKSPRVSSTWSISHHNTPDAQSERHHQTNANSKLHYFHNRAALPFLTPFRISCFISSNQRSVDRRLLMAVQTTKQGNVDYSESWKIVWNGNNGFWGEVCVRMPRERKMLVVFFFEGYGYNVVVRFVQRSDLCRHLSSDVITFCCCDESIPISSFGAGHAVWKLKLELLELWIPGQPRRSYQREPHFTKLQVKVRFTNPHVSHFTLEEKCEKWSWMTRT